MSSDFSVGKMARIVAAGILCGAWYVGLCFFVSIVLIDILSAR
jgi:hypothetical protein